MVMNEEAMRFLVGLNPRAHIIKAFSIALRIGRQAALLGSEFIMSLANSLTYRFIVSIPLFFI